MRLPAHGLGATCAALVAATALLGPADADAAKPLSPTLAVTDYCAAWSLTDRAARERLLAQVWAPDGAYSDADTPLSKGVSGLSDVIAEFQRHYPGTHFRCSAPQQHHSFMRVTWILLKADASPVTHGVDIYDMAPDGRIDPAHCGLLRRPASDQALNMRPQSDTERMLATRPVRLPSIANIWRASTALGRVRARRRHWVRPRSRRSTATR